MKKTIHFALAIFLLLSGIISPVIYAYETQTKEFTILEADFETESFDGWFPLGGQSTLSIDTRYSFKGNTSLHVSERKAAWSGPAISTSYILQPGESYHFEAQVWHECNDKKNISWTIKYETAEGESYTSIASIDASGGEWSKITGDAVIPPEATGSFIYFESDDVSLNFNIDYVIITGLKQAVTQKAETEEKIKYTFDFESDSENWRPRGNPVVERSSDFCYTGEYSLHTSNRTNTWNAPTVNISQLVKPSVSYEYSAFVMYNEKQYENSHRFLLELQYNYEGKEKYELVAEKEIQKGNWSKINGEYTIPEGATDIYLYIQTASPEDDTVSPTENDLMNFYIDNISIEDSTVKHRNELIQRIITAAILLVTAVFGVFLIIFVKNKLRETQNMLDSASKDTMTGAFNRNSYEEQISFYTSHPDKCKKIFITICDVNFLKYINDNYGHEKGDNAIRRCAAVLLNTVGKKGNVYRTGGDEFVCITKTDLSVNISKALEIESGNYMGYPFAAASGTSSYDPKTDSTPDIKEIITRSDKEMYRNKQLIKEQMKKFYDIE